MSLCRCADDERQRDTPLTPQQREAMSERRDDTMPRDGDEFDDAADAP